MRELMSIRKCVQIEGLKQALYSNVSSERILPFPPLLGIRR
ncbi:hypothetical protein ACP4OV_029574 [Aristida adscensionis]